MEIVIRASQISKTLLGLSESADQLVAKLTMKEAIEDLAKLAAVIDRDINP